MKTGRALIPIVAAIISTACASTPTGPSVMVLPGAGKSLEQFRAEDARCRQFAASGLEATKDGSIPAQRRYDMAYLQCMYTEGNQIPSSGRSSGYRSPASSAPPIPRPPSNVPPPPAGTPPPPPSEPSR
jgi:hypothetical protein